MSSENERWPGSTERLELDVTIVENTREEDIPAFETYLTEMFVHVYDEVECNVDTKSDEREP